MNKEIYSLESYQADGHSVFLAGPTPRISTVSSWRPDMIRILRAKGYYGNIFIPERRDDYITYSFETQTAWEVKHLGLSSLIAFWIPRNMQTMPALTTNIEFGEYMHSRKVVVGHPHEAEAMEYYHMRGKELNISIVHTMYELADLIINHYNGN